MSSASSPSDAWASLRHGGLLIAPARIVDVFPDHLDPLARPVEDRLRASIARLRKEGPSHSELLTIVLEQVCALRAEGGATWWRGSSVSSIWTHRSLAGEQVKPLRVWESETGGRLFVFADGEERLGVGRGRRSAARIVEWLRSAGEKLALLTNGRQFRLIHAGADHEAWAEADTSVWFETGAAGPQVDALRMLLSPAMLTPPKKGDPSPLLAAIEASRRGQAELSAELGERVRRAVELLIQSLGGPLADLDESVSPRDIYVAASRMVMRMVVVLFAEARELLPLFSPVYHRAYSLSGLREALERVGGGEHAAERLRHRAGAWPRVLALFKLVYEGSHHEALPIPRYGGGLFAPGSRDAADPVAQVLAVLEDPEHGPNDAIVRMLLRLLSRAPVRVRQGRGAQVVEMPVDFRDLSSEYIGILYEGLLDFELRRADAGDPIVFLALGDEPALPLSRLEGMDDPALENLVSKLKEKKKPKGEEGDEEDEEAEGEDDADEKEVDESAPAPTTGAESIEADTDDAHRAAHARAKAWARKAVVAGKLVSKPRSKKADALAQYEKDVADKAASLVSRVIVPGEWFLVRWGGTRKGSGTFYTRPQLAVPTVHRTLRPLAYDPPLGENGVPDPNAPPSAWTPKRPADILSLKVCDPAMGSGSFLVAALRFLTDALFASLYHHHCIHAQNPGALVTLPFGEPAAGRLGDILLPTAPDAEDFDPRLRARLKRFVLERCLYGVDLDPLAVELARLAVWVETMDRDLPFEFLRHKLKVGNSLVGTWFDRFRDYPVLAWMREGGDKNHTNGVHYKKEAWTKEIARYRTERVKDELRAVLVGQQDAFAGPEVDADALHADAAAAFEKLHQIPIESPEEREALYREALENRPEQKALREAFDTWCALWFWPADELHVAPMPRDFARPSLATRAIVEELRAEYRFFHWEFEFPDVFARPNAGFDAIVGNPPWEIQKPNSLEFFSNLDPLYRTYTKTQATERQIAIFAGAKADEHAWLSYNARLKALSNWVKNVGSPFGDGSNDGTEFSFGRGAEGVHPAWTNKRARRAGYADPKHPFLYQGSADVNTYKLFLEQSHVLLRQDGALGALVPSGIYSDLGTHVLRNLFLQKCQWEWLYSFQNARYVFTTVRDRVKIAATSIRKSGHTETLAVRFRLGPGGSPEVGELAEDVGLLSHFLPVSVARIRQFSPKTSAILEVSSGRDVAVLERAYAAATLLGDDGPDGWGIQYTTEFHMTAAAKRKLFEPLSTWEARGFKADQYGRWLNDKGDIALPFYQGVMVHQFDYSAKGWVEGTGAYAKWNKTGWGNKQIKPQFLMSRSGYVLAEGVVRGLKLAFRDIARSTDERTMMAALLPDMPCSNKVPVLVMPHLERALVLVALLNSWVFDWAQRIRQASASINYYIIEEAPLISPSHPCASTISQIAARLAMSAAIFAPWWLKSRAQQLTMPVGNWKTLWANSVHERLRLRAMLDAIVAKLYGLDEADFRWILRDCDHPVAKVCNKPFSRTLDPKGFWRVDKDQDPELRHTVLSLIAFHGLEATIAAHGGDRDAGIQAFCAQNDDDGWMLPETLRLADYGLGHDERASVPQPVRARLGDRFLPWQLEQSAEESWAECEMHARNLLGEQGFAQLMAELAPLVPQESASVPQQAVANTTATTATPTTTAAARPARPTDLFGNPVPTDLFGNPIPEKKGRGRGRR